MNRYFYIDNTGKQNGPFTPEELRVEAIKRYTLVWTNDMVDWKPANEVEELQSLFAESAGYYPPQTPPSHSATPPPAEPAYAPGSRVNMEPVPKTWLVESILVTILPFILCGSVLSLLGIVGIVSASKVESLYNAGEYALANDSSRQAKRWTVITFWVTIGWVAVLVLAFVAMLVFGFSAASLGSVIGNSVYSI